MLMFFQAQANFVYSLALLTIIAIAVVECLSLIFGISVSGILDDLLPGEVETGIDGVNGFLNWFGLGKLPFLIWLVLLLTLFSLIGFGINYFSLKLLGSFPAASLGYSLVLIITCGLLRPVCSAVAAVLPNTETSAVSTNSFEGSIARITVGRASKGNPAEAVLTDDHGKKHYVMVEPDTEGETFAANDQIVLVRRNKVNWIAISFDQI